MPGLFDVRSLVARPQATSSERRVIAQRAPNIRSPRSDVWRLYLARLRVLLEAKDTAKLTHISWASILRLPSIEDHSEVGDLGV